VIAHLEPQSALIGQATTDLTDVAGDFEQRVNGPNDIDLSTGQFRLDEICDP
jgi:hypothetical protein